MSMNPHEGASEFINRNTDTSFAQVEEFIYKQEPGRAIDALLAHVRSLPDTASAIDALMKTVRLIDIQDSLPAPKESLPHGMRHVDARKSVLGILEFFDRADVSVDAAADEKAFKLQKMLDATIRAARKKQVPKEKIIEALEFMRSHYP